MKAFGTPRRSTLRHVAIDNAMFGRENAVTFCRTSAVECLRRRVELPRELMVTLETDRLILRMLRDSDFDAYAEMCADPEVMRYIGDGQPLDRAMAWRNLAMMVGHWSLRGYGFWAAEERSSGVLVGRIGLWNREGWPGFEIGWMLRRPFWGRGYATEGARRALQFAFTQLDRPHVISLIRPGNFASIRVAERLGERRLDTTEVMGKPALLYRITRDESDVPNKALRSP